MKDSTPRDKDTRSTNLALFGYHRARLNCKRPPKEVRRGLCSFTFAAWMRICRRKACGFDPHLGTNLEFAVLFDPKRLPKFAGKQGNRGRDEVDISSKESSS